MTDDVTWTGESSWPDPDYSTQCVSAVISVHLRPADPDMKFLLEMDGKDHARAIANAADDDRWLEETKNRDASAKQTAKQLEKFRALCKKLVDHADQMQTTAVYRLSSEGVDFPDLRAKLDTASEYVDHALSSVDAAGVQESCGQPRKQAAQRVTECAAECYTALTGKAPTFTVSPSDSAVSGRWIDFLTAVFEVVEIKGSPESHARKLMEKNAKKTINSIMKEK
ncbi:MAG: hypothetical protein P8M25_18745 [Paracoccaceae bacterium]|nr:hypothetical protein [Paracoccaceae bacterium]